MTPPGAGTVYYYVTRDGESVAGTCPNVGSAVGGHRLRRQKASNRAPTATWSPPTGAPGRRQAPRIGHGAGRPDDPPLPGRASGTTPAAGATDNLTITAQDAYGNTATTYTGSKSLTFSGASASPGGNAPTVANSLGHGGRLRHRDRDHLHLRRGEHLGRQKRRDDALQSGGGEHLGHRRHDLDRLAAGGHRRRRGALQTRPRRRNATPAAGAADDLTITAQDTYGNPSPPTPAPRA